MDQIHRQSLQHLSFIHPKMWTKLFILALFTVHVSADNSGSHFSFHSLEYVIEFSRKIYDIIYTGIKHGSIIRELVNSVTDEISGDDKNSEKINNKLNDISSQLSYIVTRMEHEFEKIAKKINDLPLELEIGQVKRKIAEQIISVKGSYEETITYSNESEHYNRAELKSLEKQLTGLESDKNVRTSLKNLLNYVTQSIGDLNKNFLELYGEYIDTKKMELCGDGLSPSHYLYNLYTVIVSTEMMGMISLSFGYELQRKLFNYTTDYELKEAQSDREKRLMLYFMNFKKAIASAPLSFRSCDPPKHNRGETFFEMEDLYQVVLTEEYGKNRYDSCRGDCDTISQTSYEYNGVSCGKISNCWTIPNPTYCELANQRRRYQWFEDNAGHIYGDKTECLGVLKENSSYLYYGAWCDSCVCTCEGNSLELAMKNARSTHVISLLPSQADISNNMIVTGARLVVKDGIVQIQIKEAQLQPAGQVSEDSGAWKDVRDMKESVIQARKGSSSIYELGRDFIVVDDYNDAINLDDVIVPSGHVVTGIKFAIAEKSETQDEWQRLEIRIQYMPFYFLSGTLGHSSDPQWMSSTIIHSERIKLEEGDDPEKSGASNIPTELSNAFVKFTPSSLKKDVGQTTIPFLDAVPVESKSGALSGIGLYHKAAEGYGGFLSFRLYALNVSEYMVGSRRAEEYYMHVNGSNNGKNINELSFTAFILMYIINNAIYHI